MMKKSILISMLILVLSLTLTVSNAFAATTYTIIQITDNNYKDLAPQIHNRQITWYGNDGMDYEIFLYDCTLGTTTQITDNEYSDWRPQIHNGQITWYGEKDGPFSDDEILLYDCTSGTTTQITDNEYQDSEPQIHNGQITWYGYDGSDNEVFLYDDVSGITTQLTDNNYPDEHPQVHSGQITWEGEVNGDDEIFLATIPTIQATVDIDPNTLNLKSNGAFVTAYIELPESYDVVSIDISTVMLEDDIPAITDPQYGFVTDPSEYLVDHDGDGILERMIKFDRTEVIEYLNTIDVSSETGKFKEVTLEITGEVVGVPFEGSDAVKIII